MADHETKAIVRGTKAIVQAGSYLGRTVTVLSHGVSPMGYLTCGLPGGAEVSIKARHLKVLP
jgi:hypothetical protein